ncbi:MAG: zinc ABC transporter substrate-binding protein [Pseudomonadota bacterium]
MRTLLPSTLVALLGSTALADAPRVVVDIAPVHSIVAAVMDGVGAPDLLIPAGASPHGYSLRPSEAQALSDADLVVWVGEGLSPWLEGPIETLAEKAHHVSLLGLPDTILLDIREGATFAAHDHDHGDHAHADKAHDDHEGHDHKEAGHDDHDHDDHDHDEHAHDEHAHDAHGDKEAGHDDHGHEDHDHDHAAHDDTHEEAGHDDHGHAHADGIDPHAWLDPRNAVIWAAALAEELAELDPGNAQAYADNAATFESNINAMIGDIEVKLTSVTSRDFVVFHDAYQYFETRFGLTAAGAISASDAEDPSPKRVAELREEIEQLGAVCALTEPQFNPGILNALGDVRLGEIDPLGVAFEPGKDLYANVIRGMADSLTGCLN